MRFFGPLEGFIGMFQRLFGMLVSGLVIFFPVVRRGGTVRVCGEFVEFGGSLMRVIRHGVSLVPCQFRSIPVSTLSHRGHSPLC
jgi:hypothetical protein